MAKYNTINLSEESVSVLLKMAADIKLKYDEYAQAGNDLINSYEALYNDLGIDAEPVLDLLNRLNDELTLNCRELLELGSYCETMAQDYDNKLGTKIVTNTNFI